MTNAISSATTSQSWQVAARARDQEGANRMDKAMSGVADLLGMTTDDIREAQQNGTTLADLAKQKGVSEDDLRAALAKGLEENAPSDVPSGVDFSQMASDIVSGKGPQGPGGHHGHGSKPPQSDGTNGLQQLLQNTGIDSTQLQDLLESSLNGTTSSSTTSDASSDFATQLKNLISQYGSKGLTYDTKL